MRVFMKPLLVVAMLFVASACSNMSKRNSDDVSQSGSGASGLVPSQEMPSFRVSDPEPPQIAPVKFCL